MVIKKKIIMKVKDLSSGTNMGSVIVKTPEGKIGTWKSQWEKGVWLSGKSTRVHPVFVEDLKEALEWEVIEDPTLINLD
jgi:hypothetical protein